MAEDNALPRSTNPDIKIVRRALERLREHGLEGSAGSSVRYVVALVADDALETFERLIRLSVDGPLLRE